MPSAVSGQNDYYSRHQRRTSSFSQTSLPDQLRKSTAQPPYSPSRSAVFLPATTYDSTSSASHVQASSASPETPKLDPSQASFQFEDPRQDQTSQDPDDYYRRYNDPFAPSPIESQSIHQTALRMTGSESQVEKGKSRKSSLASNWSNEERGLHSRQDSSNTAKSPGLRPKKASVKNLVAQFNASSSDDTPPMPQTTFSAHHSRNASPVTNSAMPQFPINNRRQPSLSRIPQPLHSNSGFSEHPEIRQTVVPPQSQSSSSWANGQKQPLFGEVVSVSLAVPSPGYGIVSPRRRRGSEGSPMHSPNPMFPDKDSDGENMLLPSSTYSIAAETQNRRRRANSDLSTRPTSTASTIVDQSNPMNSPPLEGKHDTSSNIPINGERLNTNSDSGLSPPTSRTTSSTGRRQRNSDSHPQSGENPRELRQNASTVPRVSKIASPEQRGKPSARQHGSKSPSLRANIIAPPPKISPPLRSSRPRLPVSSASTAASRAKMAEKFSNMQKSNNSRKGASTRAARPPELTDIDLKARRTRITQALSKSREGLNQYGNSPSTQNQNDVTTGRATPVPPSEIKIQSPNSIPEVTVDSVITPVEHVNVVPQPDNDENETRRATQSALDALQGGPSPEDKEDDSPTLGISSQSFDRRPAPIDTTFLNTSSYFEPSSALTDATDATNIDLEPQVDEPMPHDAEPTLLSHVMQMRQSSPASSFIPSPQTAEESSDRGDVESVHLILRDTAYLDESEALEKGYRTHFAPPEPLQEAFEARTSGPESDRDSWSSALETDQHAYPNEDQDDIQQPGLATNDEFRTSSAGFNDTAQERDDYFQQSESIRETMASDAYTIVNIVLQQHANSGVVDQQFVDDVFNRVIQESPYFEDEGIVDAERIERFCLQEIHQRDEVQRQSSQVIASDLPSVTQTALVENVENEEQVNIPDQGSHRTFQVDEGFMPLPLPRFRGHSHKSSLDSAEDWAFTSPSVGDWMRFAHEDEASEGQANETHTNERQSISESDMITPTADREQTDVTHATESTHPLYRDPSELEDEGLHPEEYGTVIIQAPSSISPPPPPKDLPSIDQAVRTRTPVSLATSDSNRPQVPYRLASRGQVPTPPPQTNVEPMNPEMRRLKQRKHVLKEFVDTEFSYERDMRVLCDIYKQTALVALSEEDIRILFGNIDQIQIFSRDFLAALKQSAKPAYVMERNDRRKDEALNGILRANSSSSTLASAQGIDPSMSDSQRDRETSIGSAFDGLLAEMEKVYTEYIRNRHAANQKLESLQRSVSARDWLKECRENSNDITNAWNLDALLVKPVQRITKYPLLLKELIDATNDNHPDMPALKRALSSIIEINVRINDVKKHAELVDQVLNRKRGQSDVRTGLTKAFGRRAEKLKQHVGIADMYEDSEYNEVRISYDNNIVQLMVVANDCLSYEKGMNQWVTKMVEIAAAAESWIDVKHSHHPQAESKLRQLAMIIRGISTIALPDHLEHLQKKVIQPMQRTVETLTKFKEDPKGLLHKRDKRLVDYAQMRNKKEKGEKVDKKMAERMDQWEALNTEAKERMKKLLRATAHLVQSCQGNLVTLQMSWMAMIQQKFSTAMGLALNRLELRDIEKDWQEDFDYHEATALALGLCNGSLLLEAANMASFLTPGTTLNGDESPRQPSWSSANKRSISLNSEGSYVQQSDVASRPSATYSESHFDRPYPYTNGRLRATSAASGKSAKTPDLSSRTSNNTKNSAGSGQFGRPGTSPGLTQEAFAPPPRLSIDTPSPSIGPVVTQSTTERPQSAATFFSAMGAPAPNQRPNHRSSIFSSAMPMSDSPMQENPPMEAPPPDPEVLFTAASVYEFNIDRARREAGFPYLTYVTGEIFDVLGERGELWLAKNQDDPQKQIGWIWNKHFAKLAS